MRTLSVLFAATASLASLDAAYRNVVYYPEWAAEGGYTMATIDWSLITHINYAFAIPQADGSLQFNDEPSSLKTPYAAGLANVLKRQFRNVKIGLSIGGGAGSAQFAQAASPAVRDTFVNNAVKMMLDLGLDFIDIDWEFPSTAADMANFVQLLNSLRTKLNQQTFKAELTIASIGYRDALWASNLGSICNTVDAVNIMAYDFTGPWVDVAGYQSNLYTDGKASNSVDTLVQFYLDHCSAQMLVMGLPIYSRKFQDTDGLYKSFNKAKAESDGETQYKELPLAQEKFDATTKSAYIYNSATRTLHTYDNPQSVAEKVKYVQSHNLAGTMFWDVAQDATGDRSLVRTAFNALGGQGALLVSTNNLNYPTSQYDNVRQGSATPPQSSTTKPASPTTAKVTTKPTTKPTPSKGNGCTSYTVKDNDDVYTITVALCKNEDGCQANGYPTITSASGEKCPYWINTGDLLQVCCTKPAKL
ncbi:unnamed protein product [Aphanomyces euteiches]